MRKVIVVEKYNKITVCLLMMSSLECRLLQKLHLKRLHWGPKDNSLFFFEMYFLIIFSWQKNTYGASVKTSCLHALCTFDTTTTYIKRVTHFKNRVQGTHSGYGNRHYKSRVNFDKASTLLKVRRFTSSAFVFYIP